MGKCKMKKRGIAAVAAVLLAGTAAAKEPDVSNLDFGTSPQEPIAIAKQLMAYQLKDPESAQYRWVATYLGYCKQGWAKGKGLDWYGWAATIEVNAKNSYGGYTGFEPYTILYKDQQAVRAIKGANFGPYGPSTGPLGLGGGAGLCRRVD